MLSRVLVYPRTEFFTELWILDANHRAENYPFNISFGQSYNVYLGIANRLGSCAYYMVKVKFRNQTQPAPESFGPIENRAPSSLQALYSFPVFAADEQTVERQVNFSFNYKWNENRSKVFMEGLSFNGVMVGMDGYTLDWSRENGGFTGFLFFELWIYNSSVNGFKYHGRFVGLRLNMTVSD
jgi:hypothetical protein